MKNCPEELLTLAEHLEMKATLADATAEDHFANNEQHPCLRQRRRAQNARDYAGLCRWAAGQLREKKERKKAATMQICDEPAFKALALIFKRGERCVWSPEEVKVYRSLRDANVLTEENLTALARYHAAEQRKGQEGRHRRDLGTFLNNFTGELDRARASVPMALRPPSNPDGWEQFWREERQGRQMEQYQFAADHNKTDFRAWKGKAK